MAGVCTESAGIEARKAKKANHEGPAGCGKESGFYMMSCGDILKGSRQITLAGLCYHCLVTKSCLLLCDPTY